MPGGGERGAERSAPPAGTSIRSAGELTADERTDRRSGAAVTIGPWRRAVPRRPRRRGPAAPAVAAPRRRQSGATRRVPRAPSPRRSRAVSSGAGATALRQVDEFSAGGLVLDLAGEIPRGALIARTDRHGRLLWSLPKGHIEAGETAEQAAVREVEEETGIAGDDPRRARHHRLLVRRRGPAHPQDGAALPDARGRRRAVRRRRRGHRGRLGAAARDRAPSWPTPTSAGWSTPRAGCSRKPREHRHAQGSARARGARGGVLLAGAVHSGPPRRPRHAPAQTRRLTHRASSTSRRTRPPVPTKPKPLDVHPRRWSTTPTGPDRTSSVSAVARRPDRDAGAGLDAAIAQPHEPSATGRRAAHRDASRQRPRPGTTCAGHAHDDRRAPTTRPPATTRRLPVRERDLPVLVHRRYTDSYGRRTATAQTYVPAFTAQPGVKDTVELGLAAARPAAPAAPVADLHRRRARRRRSPGRAARPAAAGGRRSPPRRARSRSSPTPN